MSTLKSIVLSIANSQSLVERGIVLDATALVWIAKHELDDENDEPTIFPREDALDDEGSPMYNFVSAPTLSELLDAIRTKVSGAVISIFHRRDFGVDIDLDDDASAYHYGVGQYPSDLEAAAALLMEMSK